MGSERLLLTASISELGGKHGALEFLRDNTNIAPWLVPNVLLSSKDKYTSETENRIRSLCELHNRGKVIIRTSEQSDWNCMVDTMPTEVCSIDTIQATIDTIKQKCRAASLCRYATLANNGYNPENVSISIAPEFQKPQFTLTEHPNQTDVLLLDVRDDYKDAGGWLVDTIDIDSTNITDVMKEKMRHASANITSDTITTAIRIRDVLRNSGSFSDDDALQFEYVLQPRSNNPFITQIRRLAKKQRADFTVPSGYLPSNRIFGLSDNSNPILFSTKKFRTQAIKQGEQTQRPYVLFPEVVTNKLTHLDFGPNMVGYVAGTSRGSEALCHNNTRFVQQVLNAGGVAVLDYYTSTFLSCKPDFRFKTDGKNYTID